MSKSNVTISIPMDRAGGWKNLTRSVLPINLQKRAGYPLLARGNQR